MPACAIRVSPVKIPSHIHNIRWAVGLLCVGAGSLLVWWLMGRPFAGIDDSDIFFVYARNFAEGHGFVYNIGGERVEGFTSLLWTLICAACFRVFGQPELPLFLLNIVFGMIVLSACLRRTSQSFLFLLFIVAAPSWLAWCHVTLMETGLWCLLATLLGLAVAERRAKAAMLLLPLFLITRPESMVWGAWAILLFILMAGPGKRIGLGLSLTVVYAATLAALVGFRLSYFGYPVPNTYYAKVSPSLATNLWNGLGYLFGYLFSSPVVPVLAATCGWVLFCGLRNRKKGIDPAVAVALFLLPGVGIPVLVGGDHFGAYRFYQSCWPLLCLLAAWTLPPVLGRVRARVRRGVFILLVAVPWMLFPLTANLRYEFRIARDGRAAGSALAGFFGNNGSYPTLSVITAGGSKFSYPGHVYDLMGLNSTEMAHAQGNRRGCKNHSAFNRDVFYRWQPDIVLCGDSRDFDSLVLNGLHEECRFQKLYVRRSFPTSEGTAYAYFSRALLEKHTVAPGLEL